MIRSSSYPFTLCFRSNSSSKKEMSFSSNFLRWAYDHSLWAPSFVDWPRAMRCIDKGERTRIREFRYQEDAKAALVGKLSAYCCKIKAVTVALPVFGASHVKTAIFLLIRTFIYERIFFDQMEKMHLPKHVFH